MYLTRRGVSLEAKLNRPINGRLLVTWPSTACGQAEMAPSSPTKSRRLIVHSRSNRDRQPACYASTPIKSVMVQVSRAALVGNPPIKLWTTQRISQGRVVRHSKFGSRQKRTLRRGQTMLPPKADIVGTVVMSAKCQKRTFQLFDDTIAVAPALLMRT